MPALLSRKDLSVIKLDLYGGTQPCEATYTRLARDLRDHLRWLARIAQHVDQWEDISRTQEALRFITAWRYLMEYVSDAQARGSDESIHTIFDVVAAVHDECYGESDASEKRALDSFDFIGKAFQLYGGTMIMHDIAGDEGLHDRADGIVTRSTTLVRTDEISHVVRRVDYLTLPLEAYLTLRA